MRPIVRSLRGGIIAVAAVALLAAAAPLVSGPVARAAGGTLTGQLIYTAANSATPPVQFDLTGPGTEDWAVWGFANGGTSTSLAPDVRRAGGNAISALTDIEKTPAIPLRGLGAFAAESPFLFNWTNGSGPATGSSAPLGIQHNTRNSVNSSGYGFSFTVPAGTVKQTLTVWVHAHGGAGKLTASLSDGSAPTFVDTSVGSGGGHNAPGVYQLDFASSSPNQTLTVTWTLDHVVIGPNSITNNAAIYAVALKSSASVSTPAIVRAVSNGSAVALTGRVDGGAGVPVTLSVKSSTTCANGALGGIPTTLGTLTVTPGADTYFNTIVPVAVPLRSFVTISATSPNTTGPSTCAVVAGDNDAWPRAFQLDSTGDTTQDVIDSPGQSRWYKVGVLPGSQLTVDLTNLPTNYDLAVFKDISQAYTTLSSTQNLTHLSAEFAPSAFSPSAFSPSAFSPSAFSPDAYAPSAFSPSAFSPSVFSPSAFSPSAFSPSAFSPSAFSPSAFSPSAFSPSAFSPSAFSPSAFSPSAFSPDDFASAQTRSLVAVAATPGTADERIVANTWTNTGNYYIRVSGPNGAFSTSDAFRVTVTKVGTSCAGVTPIGSAPTSEPAGAFKTIILTNFNRLPGSAADMATLQSKLAAFAARPEIQGQVVDFGSDARVAALDAQADANTACPYAKNLVAGSIKDVVDAYRASNPGLKYVVIVGGDSVVPFFRYPDETLLGQESGYVPPVGDTTASEASLQLDYVLGQDAYGASDQISLRSTSFPVPDLAVGRLVETASEASGMLDAYTAANGSVTPHSSLVTGYDFLADDANSVRDDLAAGTAQTPDTLIAPNNISPQDPASWTATQLKTALLGSRHDLVFLAGHFSANSALAADFSTSLLTTDVASSTADFTNSLVFSAGCHSGYNIVDSDAVPGVTQPLDWAQTFARKRATLVAGTGYQYGDTDFIEYSERIYANFAKQLRTGPGIVPVGAALVRAKQQYLASTPDIRGLHEKALLEATLFGLPMLGVNMPGTRLPAPGAGSVVNALTPFTTNPGATLGLSSFDLTVTPSLTPVQVLLTNLAGGTLTATYFRGAAGVVTNPAEPALPLESRDVTPPPNSNVVLRGVGFRGGTFNDSTVIPLTGAPTTDLRGVHAPFVSPVFYPMRLATPNYFAALSGGATTLLVTPAQHRALSIADGTSTLRLYSDVSLRLFYSGYLGASALSAAPDIVDVKAAANSTGGVDFTAHIVGNPAAGIQQVWITYTGDGPSRWASLDLTPDTKDSSIWRGTLPSIGPPDTLRFMIQAANGVGLVTLDDNLGAYYRVAGAVTAPPVATTLTLQAPPSSGTYGGEATVTAQLSAASGPLAGKSVLISVGGSSRAATTDAGGTAVATVPLVSVPGQTKVTATFAGDDANLASGASAPFTLAKAPTSLSTLSPLSVVTADGTSAGTTALTAALGAKTQPLLLQTVTFVVSGSSGSKTFSTITDYLGRASLPPTGLAPGTYSVTATFAGDQTYTGATRTGSVVITAFTGFFQPVDDPPFENIVNAGRTVPVKFSLGGNFGLAIFAPGFPAVVPVACPPSAPTDVVETTLNTSVSSLQFDGASGQYTYLWKTQKGWTGCRDLQLMFVDGTVRIARFKFS